MSDTGEVPFVKVYNLTFDGTLDFSKSPTFISRETHEGALRRSRSAPGDVLMNIVGPPLGKVSILPDAFPEWNFNQAIVAFQVDSSRISNRFLAAYLRHESARWASRFSKATVGQHNIAVSDCRAMELPLPPLEEQGRIVAKLEALESRSRRARDALDSIALLESQLVDWWTRATLPQETLGQHVVHKTRDVGPTWQDFPLLGLSNDGEMVERREPIGLRSAPKCRVVEPGDIVFNPIRFSIGSVARYRGSVPAIVSPEYQVFTTHPTLSSELLARYLRTPRGRRHLGIQETGSVRYRVYFKDLASLAVPLAPVAEQARAERLLRFLSELAPRVETVRGMLTKMDSAILAKALRGELVPQDPNDEPAQVMLSRLGSSGARGARLGRSGGSKAAK
jgi:hypothetical protein